jgi:hypothetical protein
MRVVPSGSNTDGLNAESDDALKYETKSHLGHYGHLVFLPLREPRRFLCYGWDSGLRSGYGTHERNSL